MKILVVSNYRGLHTCRPEAEIFIGLKKLGYDITVMTYPDAVYIERFKANGIRVIPQHPTKKDDRKFIKLLRAELRDGAYDILQLYNNKAISNGIQSAKDQNVKVVIYRGTSSNMAWWNPINYLKFFHPRVDHVICNSEEIRQKFLAVPMYNAEKAVTIFKGHDTDWYSDIQPLDIRKEMGIKAEDLLLVNVANNRKVKAIPDLMKAMRYIPKDAKISLLVIGENMGKEKIKRAYEASDNTDKIHFLGYRQDSINIVASCDAFVLPSIGGESLTKSVIEAMCLGVVPIISDIAGNAPLVDHAKNGLIFKKSNPKDLAAKIMYLYAHQEQIPSLSTGAKQKIDRDIHTSTTIAQYDRYYRSIIN